MNFPTSTHKRDWLFDADTLRQKHAAAQQAALDSLRASTPDAAADGAPDAKKQRADCPISLEDEAQLKLFFQVKLKAICQQQNMPSKVLSTALVFFKRFYCQASCLEHDPLRVMPTCIYLAAKVEEAYRSAGELCKRMGVEPGQVLRFEVPLLQGLQFDLVVHSPYRALAGLVREFEGLRQQQSQLLDPQLLAASSEQLAAAHAKARASADVLLMTDAPLLHPPGLLAVAALRSGFRGAGLPCQRYLQHIAAKAAAAAADANGAAAGDGSDGPEGRLLAALAAVDELAWQQAGVNEAALQQRATEVDRAIKLWKKGLQQQQGGKHGGGSSSAGGALAAAAAVAAGGAG